MSQHWKSDIILSWQACIWFLRSGLSCVRCHVLRCNSRRNRRRPGLHHTYMLLSQSRVWKGLPFLMEEPRRSLLDSRVFKKWWINTRVQRLRRQMLTLRSLTVKRSRKHETLYTVEFSRGNIGECRVNQSTSFLIGLEVIRAYGLAIDYHHSGVYSNVMKRYFLCALLPTGHLALEMIPKRSEQGTVPSVESCPLDSALGPTTKGTGKRNASA